MLSKNKIKYVNALKLAKNRKKYNHFIAEGDKICQEILKNSPALIHTLFCLPQWHKQHQSNLGPLSHKIVEITPAELKKISNLKTPNQVLIVANQPDYMLDKFVVQQNLILLLDQIQDPGNMGTILRIADWFGIPYVICSPNCVDIYNPKVVQAAMGAFLRVQVFVKDLPSFCQQYPDISIYGTVLDGANLFQSSLPSTAFIVIGNESRGISEGLQTCLTHRLTIPRYGGAESLNAAVATGIVCSFFNNRQTL